MRNFRLVMGVALAAFLVPTLEAKAQEETLQHEPQINTVFIIGEVSAPGVYELKSTEGVPELIARAGGATPSAALTQVTVRRAATTTTVNVFAALRQNGAKPVFALHGGDFVIVPRNSRRVYVGGEVMSPDSFAIPENGKLSVALALALAGGLRSNQAAVKIIIARQTANGNLEQREVPANVTDPKFNEPLQNGDVVVVVRSAANCFGPRQAPPNASLWLLARKG